MAANDPLTPRDVTEAERANPTDELGVTGLVEWHGLVEEAYLPELRYPQVYKKYSEMRRRDPTLASLSNAINLLARTTLLSTEAGGSTENDKRAQEFLDQCLDDMSVTKEDAFEDLLSAKEYGWAWSELVYKRRLGPNAEYASKYDDGKIGWRKWAPRRQGSFERWQFDAAGGVQGLWQLAPFDRKQVRRYMPIQKSLHFVAQRDMGNPEGMSIYEPAYESWHYVKNLSVVEGIGWERSFNGLPVFAYGTPENPYEPTEKDKELVARIGKQLRVDEKAYVALPGQIGFELASVTNSNANGLIESVKQRRIGMLMVVLADFIALGTVTTGGSYALGQDKSELFLMAVDGWLDKLCMTLNRYAVPRLFAYNDFGPLTEYPTLKHTSVQKPNLPALASYLSALSLYIPPTPTLEEYLRKLADLPEEPEGAEDDIAPADTTTTGSNANADPGTPEDGSQGDPNANKLARRRASRRGRFDERQTVRYYEREFLAAQAEWKRAMGVK